MGVFIYSGKVLADLITVVIISERISRAGADRDQCFFFFFGEGVK